MKYLEFIEQVPLVRNVDSCTTTGDVDYPGTAFEVRVPDGDEIMHVVVDGAGEQQFLFLGQQPFRIPLELLEQILARAKEVVKPRSASHSNILENGQCNCTTPKMETTSSPDHDRIPPEDAPPDIENTAS